MTKCDSCGYLNNDGSKICLNCRTVLRTNSTGVNADIQNIQSISPITSLDPELQPNSITKKKQSHSPLLGLIPVLIVAVVLGLAKFGEWWRSVDLRLAGTWQVESADSLSLDDWTLTLPLSSLNRWRFSKDGNIEVDITNAHVSFQNYKYYASKKYGILGISKTDVSGLDIEYRYQIEKSDGQTYLYIFDYLDSSLLKITFIKTE